MLFLLAAKLCFSIYIYCIPNIPCDSVSGYRGLSAKKPVSIGYLVPIRGVFT